MKSFIAGVSLGILGGFAIVMVVSDGKKAWEATKQMTSATGRPQFGTQAWLDNYIKDSDARHAAYQVARTKRVNYRVVEADGKFCYEFNEPGKGWRLDIIHALDIRASAEEVEERIKWSIDFALKQIKEDGEVWTPVDEPLRVYWTPNGQKCPKCGEPLYDNTQQLYLTDPPQISTMCKSCSYTGSRIR